MRFLTRCCRSRSSQRPSAPAAVCGQSRTESRRYRPIPGTIGVVVWRRRVRYFRERLPGHGVILNSVDRGEDAPMTRRDDRSLVLIVVALVVVPSVVVATGIAVASLLR